MPTARREFMRQTAAAAAAAVAGIPLPGWSQDAASEKDVTGAKWSKAPCRFCGTGCGVMVGVKDNRVIATRGDPDAEVNKGLNCVKGYFLSKIMYGEDRLTTPLLRMKPITAEAMQWRAFGSMWLLRKPAFISLLAA